METNVCELHRQTRTTQSKKKELVKSGLRGLLEGYGIEFHRIRIISKKAISSNGEHISEKFKCARNQANNAVKHAKKRQFSDNSEASQGNPRKTSF